MSDTAEKVLTLSRRKTDSIVWDEQTSSMSIEALTTADIRQIIHELRVNQLKLEAQNAELCRAHAELQEAKHRYFELFEHAPVGYVSVAQNGQILDANLAACRLFNAAKRAVLKQPISKFIVDLDQDAYYLMHKQLFETGEPHACELRLTAADAAGTTVRLNASVVYERAVPVSRVIITNLTAQQREDATKTTLAALVASAGVAIVSEDLNGHVTAWNTGATAVFGYSEAEMVGNEMACLFPAKYAPEIPDVLERLLREEVPEKYETICQRNDGQSIPVSVALSAIKDDEGNIIGVSSIFFDVTERKRADAKLQQINAELERRVEQRTLELQATQRQYAHTEKLSAIGRLAASIAHEFNNPLQSIMSVLRGVRKRAVMDDEDRALTDAAVGECTRIKNLIQSLQDFNRPTSGRRAPMNIRDSVEAILLLHRSDFRSKKITVVQNYASDVTKILAVADQIKQVFLNLLANASDACEKIGGTITISLWREQEFVALSIRDTGIGIQPTQLDQIFQPFYTTKAAVKGTGLGLPVCYGIVKDHGGSIQVNSTPGEGTTFTVRLPVHRDQILVV